jgi:hypothetical protein
MISFFSSSTPRLDPAALKKQKTYFPDLVAALETGLHSLEQAAVYIEAVFQASTTYGNQINYAGAALTKQVSHDTSIVWCSCSLPSL